MAIEDLGDVLDEVKLLLNFNPRQTNQDFTVNNIKRVINRVYEREVSLAKTEGGKLYFMAKQDCTWEADELTFTLPKFAQRGHILTIQDITNSSSSMGSSFVFSDFGNMGGPFWVDRKTLQYGSVAPASDVTIRFYYLAVPEELIKDSDIPDLIPEDHREVLIWSSAIRLRKMGDEAAPRDWIAERDEMRMDFHKYVGRGRPNDNVPWIRPNEAELSGIIY